MAASGFTIKTYFKRILEAALPTIGEYNEFVKKEAVPRPDLESLGLSTDSKGDVIDENRLDDIRIRIADQFFQRREDLKTWVAALASRYTRLSIVQEAVKRLQQEQAKPPLWAITDDSDSDQFVVQDAFLVKALSYELKSRYRLDSFEPLLSTRNSEQDLDQDKLDFQQAGCIVVSRTSGDDSSASPLINNIIDLALAAHESGEVAPRVIFTAGTREQALALRTSVTDRWITIPASPPPFLFLIPSDDQKEIAEQRKKAKVFLTSIEALPLPPPEPPPPPPPPPPEAVTENDLVILIGGKLTTDDDAIRFNQLTKLLGNSDLLVIVQPWSDAKPALEWNLELERKLATAKRPLLIEHVGEKHDPPGEASALAEYLLRSALSCLDDAESVLQRSQSMVASTSRRRLIWKPSGAEPKASAGAEISMQAPAVLAPLVQRRLGLAEDAAPFPAYVAVEEIIVDKKADNRLRRALKKHLSIVVGGDGKPPSTDFVVPFPFRVLPDRDPLHKAVEKFRPSRANIVAACDVSRGSRPLKQYLTEINARIRDGVNTYFKDKSDQAPDCILRIVVMIDDPDQLDTELTDNADGSWRVIKFVRKADEYEPDLNDFESAQAWINEQVGELKPRPVK